MTRFGKKDFVVATADSIDNNISIKHSSDISKKIKYYLRFAEGVVKVRDLTYQRVKIDEDKYVDKVKIIISRDDEEIIIYEFDDFKVQSFWQRFYQSSNYIFEWPYICYISGEKQIIIQNGFTIDTAVYLEPKLGENETISEIFVTDSYILYYIVSCEDTYKVYERDLEKIMQVILKQ